MHDSLTVSVQAEPRDRRTWIDLALRLERAGYYALLAPDHLGVGASPFVALAAAAAVTDRLKLGSCVSQTGIRNPLMLVSDAATLDVVSDGRAQLGLGAGHTPSEWSMIGECRPAVVDRVARFIEVANACRRMLDGETVTVKSKYLRLVDASLTQPRPRQERLPLMVGTSNITILGWAAQSADIVSMTGFGRTLADGHSHVVRWSDGDVDLQVNVIDHHAEESRNVVAKDVLVQFVEIAADAEASANRLGDLYGINPADLLTSPYAWLGTVDEIVAGILRNRSRWGISRYTVREEHLDAVDAIRARWESLRSASEAGGWRKSMEDINSTHFEG